MAFEIISDDGVVFLRSGLLESAGGLVHAFTTRLGGVSSAERSSMDLGVYNGREADTTMQNYNIIMSKLGLDVRECVLSRQVHEDRIEAVTKGHAGNGLFRSNAFKSADGLITAERQINLIVFNADCVPIILYDRRKKTLACVHSGWRGTVLAIAGKAVREMRRLFGSESRDIICAIGPSIGPCCYEIGGDVAIKIKEAFGPDAEEILIGKSDEKYMADLWAANERVLIREGVPRENIDISRECTCHNGERYFSYRRQGEARGSLAAIASLK